MAGLYSERNIRARIQEFENHVSPDENSLPTPKPRNTGTKPPVAPRGFTSSTASGDINNLFKEVLDDPPTALFPKPQTSKKLLNSVDLVKPLVKAPPQLSSRPSLRRTNNLNLQDEEDAFKNLSFSPVTIGKEILESNNHNNSDQNDYMNDGLSE